MAMELLTINQPDDWHIHLREGQTLQRTVMDACRQFNRVLAMPNLSTPVTHWQDAISYCEQIIKNVPANMHLEPVMTLYLTESTRPKDIVEAIENGVNVFKLYPRGVTTQSDRGIGQLDGLESVLAAIEEHRGVLCIHAESPDPNIDIFEREAHFIQTVLNQWVNTFPNLRIVVEHISTKTAVEFVLAQNANVAATITAHHLLLNRNDLLAPYLKPHHYCLPILKQQSDQLALHHAISTGSPKFFLGSDSAPHFRSAKESACGCAGIYTGQNTIALYLEIFERLDALDKFNAFASEYGAAFYQYPKNTETVQYIRKPIQVQQQITVGTEEIVPLYAGEMLAWQQVKHIH